MNPQTTHSIRVWGTLALLLAGLFVFGLLATLKLQRKAAPKTPFTIGVLISSDSRLPVVEGLKDGLFSLGVDNFAINLKNAEGDFARIESLLDDLIRERPDYIIAIGGLELDLLVRAKTDIPKFFALATQPGRHGAVFPGVESTAPNGTYERMEIAKKILPEIKKFTLLTSTTTLGGIISGEKAREFAAKNRDYSIAVLEFSNVGEVKRFASTIEA